VRAERAVLFQPFVRAERAVLLTPAKKNTNGNTLHVMPYKRKPDGWQFRHDK